ncbi:MAG: NIPSNAP family protein [Parvibaculaceae bacterium]
MTTVYELRRYVAVPGKEQALRRRFEDGTLALFRELGIRVVDFWETVAAPVELWYVLEWPSEPAMKETWNAFRANGKWLALKSESETGGPIVASITSTLLTRVPFFSAPNP